MRSRVVAVMTALILLCGACTTPNLYIASESHEDHSFKKREKIVVAANDGTADSEQKMAKLTIDVMTREGFQIVSSADSADHMLIVTVTDSMKRDCNYFCVSGHDVY